MLIPRNPSKNRSWLAIFGLAMLTILYLTVAAMSQDVTEARDFTDRCEIALIDVKTKKVSVLGEFKFIRHEGARGEASFRLPGTKLYVVGWAGLDDESLRSPTEFYSVSMELLISRTRDHNVEKSLQHAFSEMLATSESGRLAFSTRFTKRPSTVSMICHPIKPQEVKN